MIERLVAIVLPRGPWALPAVGRTTGERIVTDRDDPRRARVRRTRPAPEGARSMPQPPLDGLIVVPVAPFRPRLATLLEPAEANRGPYPPARRVRAYGSASAM